MHRVFNTTFFGALLAACFLMQPPNVNGEQLQKLLDSSQVELTASGNGNSSGMAVLGFLKNNTPSEIRIDIFLEDGMYLKNSGNGQNMVALLIFHSGGSYYSDGSNYFLVLPSRENIPVVFIAFCADFDRDNPSQTQSFRPSTMPQGLRGIVSRLARFSQETFDSDSDYTTAIQLALWRFQGNTKAKISEKFGFDDEDWDIATGIIGS